MIAYKHLKTTLLSMLVVYVVVSCTGRIILRHGKNPELFPFFAWTLYSRVPNEKSDFGIRLVAVDGGPLAESTYLEDAEFGPVRIHNYRLVQRLGNAVQSNDKELADETRQLIETRYFKGQSTSVKYQLVSRRFDVVRRWRDQVIDSETVLCEFEFRDQGNSVP